MKTRDIFRLLIPIISYNHYKAALIIKFLMQYKNIRQNRMSSFGDIRGQI